MILDQSYIGLKYQVIKAERRVLKELGFCVHIKHPHKLIVLYLQVLGLETKNTLMQLAWNYMNDSLRTDVFVRYQPETVACACIYLTARRLKMPMPKSPPWFSIFKVEEKDIQDICVRILRLYARPKAKADVLEKKVQELVKKFEENRQKSKAGLNTETSGTNTPTSPNVAEKKSPPKRRSHSDRSRSRSKSPSASPRHKKSKKHKKSVSRSRSRSRSYEKKYKKSRKSGRRSKSSSPPSKTYKDKKYRSRSRSYEREYPKKLPNDGKYYSDRYKEEKGFDRYYKDDKHRKDKSSGKDDEKHKKADENYRRDDGYKNSNSIKRDKKSRAPLQVQL
ncbi:hypothetical protein RUM44_004111 [Polyplax serrata]|uniref:Cyclin-L2 n=1 Tax=Polyplax serrata TaxID=468196 RepID=A0ABR1B1X0_POLSC